MESNQSQPAPEVELVLQAAARGFSFYPPYQEAPKQKSCFGKTEEISVLTRGDASVLEMIIQHFQLEHWSVDVISAMRRPERRPSRRPSLGHPKIRKDSIPDASPSVAALGTAGAALDTAPMAPRQISGGSEVSRRSASKQALTYPLRRMSTGGWSKHQTWEK
ncbi:unnamed protein product [Cladocopium goreaui]|uniref:Uncharacterized protein n=1 Tax=Cladocopium goreaui TaxID=2562237 RepID=A0A9P1CCA7_9DINO|nr:unnamed protein product [Cladocopium goreaui]